MKKLIMLCALMVSLVSLNTYADLSEYAVDDRRIFPEFIFLPIKGSDTQGAFLYTRYKKTVLTPVSIGSGWRSVAISLSPTAIGSTALNQFISTNNIIDNRKNLIPTDAELCLLSADAKRKIAELGLTYNTAVLVGGYPKACTLIVRYYTAAQSDLEKSLVNYLTVNNVVSLSFSIEEVLPAVSVSFHDIINQLYSNDVLQIDAQNNYYGSISAVTFHAAQLSPVLFGELDEAPISFVAWELFLNAFTLSGKTLKVQLTSSNETLSIPGAREEIVNVNATL
ncbi:MAG TPA: hypothetical protein VLC79_04545 [Cellvibrio sp.]|nr:hypothetical protein [Cellvibrio sp.]